MAGFPKLIFKEPTPEERRAASEAWAARVRDTFIDRWPKDLAALSMPTRLVRFDKELAKAMFDGSPATWKRGHVELAAEIDAICGWDRKFFRLNSRSPKDFPWPFEVPISCSGREMLSVFASSERALDDIVMFYDAPDPLFICLRDWVPGMQPAWEFRCFVKDGDLLAVAEYGLEGLHFEPDADPAFRRIIDRYFAETVRPRLHIDTVVFDVYVGGGLAAGDAPMLIEINPYGLSDPVGAGSYDAIERGISGIARRPLPASQACDSGRVK